MVNKITKTYSVENGQIRKEVTFSTEESLYSQSPASYSSNTPVKYGLIDYNPPSFHDNDVSVHYYKDTNTPLRYGFNDDSGVISLGFGALVMDYPFSSQSSESYSSNTPVKYGLIKDIVGALLDIVKEAGLDKICGYYDLMKSVSLAFPRAGEQLSSQSPTSYSSINIDQPDRPAIIATCPPHPGKELLPSQSPVSYSSNTPVKYGLIDDTIRAVLEMIELGGVDKFCGSCKMEAMGLPSTDKLCNYCKFMEEMGILDSPTVIGYGGIYGGGYSTDFIPL